VCVVIAVFFLFLFHHSLPQGDFEMFYFFSASYAPFLLLTICLNLFVPSSVSAQWRRLPTSGDPPPARAYHSMTCVGSRYLLFGGFDGKSTYGDLWWLVPEGTRFTFK
jgi:hypothetical protein